MFDPDDDLTRNNIAWFLMEDFLRLSPWRKGLGEKFLAGFVAYCESYAQDVENAILVIKVCRCSFWETEKQYCHTWYFFPDNDEIFDNSEIFATPWT